MSYSVWQEYPYEEPGTLRARIVPTDERHIYFDALQNSGSGKDHPRACFIELRGIVYGLGVHFYKWADGSWNIGPEGEPEGTRFHHNLHLNRFGKPASDAARRKAAEIATAIVRKWTEENPQALHTAQARENERKAEKLREKLADLRAQVAAAQAELDRLEGR